MLAFFLTKLFEQKSVRPASLLLGPVVSRFTFRALEPNIFTHERFQVKRESEVDN